MFRIPVESVIYFNEGKLQEKAVDDPTDKPAHFCHLHSQSQTGGYVPKNNCYMGQKYD